MSLTIAQWRYTLLAGLAAIEFHLVTRPPTSSSLGGLAPFQIVLLLHRIYIAAICAVNHLGPVLFPLPATPAAALSDGAVAQLLLPHLARLRRGIDDADAQAFTLLHADAQGLLRDPGSTPGTDRDAARQHNAAAATRVKEGMVAVLAEGAIRSDSEGGEAWKAACARRPVPRVSPKRSPSTTMLTPKRAPSTSTTVVDSPGTPTVERFSTPRQETPAKSPVGKTEVPPSPPQLPTPRATPEPEGVASEAGEWEEVRRSPDVAARINGDGSPSV
jgi:hypothetical protein